MTTYTLNGAGAIVRGDGATIPVDSNNTDYVEYLAWSSLGNTASITVVAAKTTQASIVAAACQAAIYAGFPSTALGSAHTYPAKDTDQQNLASSVLSSLMPNLPFDWSTPFWCASQDGSWSFQMHSVTQIQQVGIDGKAAILAAMGKNRQLQEMIAAATTVEAVQAINW